jgi:pimeloyl-ACP methyl ester carboxylesterase
VTIYGLSRRRLLDSLGFVVALAFGTIASTSPASAQIVINGGAPNRLGGSQADSTPAYLAGPFSFNVSATIFQVGSSIRFNTLSWSGFYFPPITSAPIGDIYTMTIYADAGGAIGANLYTIDLGSGSPTATGFVIPPLNPFNPPAEYRYTASFAPITLDPGNYFLALSRVGDPSTVWSWEATSGGAQLGGATYGNIGGIGASKSWGYFASEDLAFNFCNNACSTLLDPVPYLLSGPAVTTDPTVLAQFGREVQGVAADGIARLVVRIASDSTNPIELALFNDANQISSSTAEDGSITSLLPGDNCPSASQCTLTPTGPTGGPYAAYAVYLAPLDFVRPNFVVNDTGTTSRRVYLSTNGSAASGTTAVEIVAPPIALIHGIWADPTTWGTLTNTLLAKQPPGPWANLYTIDYSPWNWDYIDRNRERVLSALIGFLHSFKVQKNVAAVQFDLVTHSMGGLISRDMPFSPRFASNSTYGAGLIHKLITIDTPHLGTRFATNIWHDSRACYDFFSRIGKPIAGAVRDMQVSSSLLQRLNGSTGLGPIPTHAIVGIASSQQEEDIRADLWPLRNTCLTLGIVNRTGFEAYFGGQSDLLVPIASQAPSSLFGNPSYVVDVIHFALPWVLPKVLSLPDVVDSPATAAYVTDLLEGSASDPSLFEAVRP